MNVHNVHGAAPSAQMKPLVLLGGYGGAGRDIAALLLRETDACLVIAGRDLAKAEAFAEQLAAGSPGRVNAAQADADRPESLGPLLRDACLLLDLTPGAKRAHGLALAALRAGADYMDIHFQQTALEGLAPLSRDYEAAGRLLLTQAGSHPGLPAVLVRAASARLDACRSALVGMGLAMRVETQATALELVEEIMFAEGALCEDGVWRTARGSDIRVFDLGPRFGRRACYPMRMPELEALPGLIGLRETGAFVAGFNPVVDCALIPLLLACGRLGLRSATPLLARLFTWGVNTFSRGEPHMALCVDAQGERQGGPASARLLVEHPSPYLLTAAAVVAYLRQYLDGGLTGNGLRFMGHAAEPERILADMARMGVRVAWESG